MWRCHAIGIGHSLFDLNFVDLIRVCGFSYDRELGDMRIKKADMEANIGHASGSCPDRTGASWKYHTKPALSAAQKAIESGPNWGFEALNRPVELPKKNWQYMNRVSGGISCKRPVTAASRVDLPGEQGGGPGGFRLPPQGDRSLSPTNS